MARHARERVCPANQSERLAREALTSETLARVSRRGSIRLRNVAARESTSDRSASWRATIAAILSSLIAFPASYALAFKVSETARRWAVFFLILPFFTSYLVRVYAWQVLLAESGPINAFLGFAGLGPFTMLNSGFGAMVGYMTLVLPLVVILQTFSLSAIDRNLIEAAWNLGASPRATLFNVIVPAAKVGLILGAVFAFILSFGDFVSPFYLGGSKPPTLSILIIDTTKSGQQWPRAAVVAVMMIVTLFVVAFAAVGAAYGRRK